MLRTWLVAAALIVVPALAIAQQFYISNVGYAGPGDLGISFIQWSGARAFSNAATFAKVIRLQRASDSTQEDINSLVTGALDYTTAQAFCTSTTCAFATAYDKIGTNCSGVCDLVQATSSAQPAFGLYGPNNIPCAQFAGASSQNLTTANSVTSQSQPFTIYAVAERTSNATAQQSLLSSPSNNVGLYFSATSGNVVAYAGTTSANVAASENTFHVIIAVINGSSSSITVDGITTSSLAVGALGFSGKIGWGKAFDTFYGQSCEAGLISGVLSSTLITALTANVRKFYGF
jgi:hypothetical protein